MKKVFLKSLDIVLTLVMVCSVIYALFNLIMSFLPVDIQEMVYSFLRMTKESATTFSVSAAINAGVMVATKITQTYTRIRTASELMRAEQVMKNDTAVNEAVIERANAIINNMSVTQKQLDALLTMQAVNANRNIKSSDMLVLPVEKEEYRNALVGIEEAKAMLAGIDNITTVYEREEVKEVVVEREVDSMSGRV